MRKNAWIILISKAYQFMSYSFDLLKKYYQKNNDKRVIYKSTQKIFSDFEK